MLKTLREIIADAEKRRIAIGHFNVSELAAFRAVTKAARDLNVPVIIGTSEGERDFIDIHDAVAMVRDLREKHGQQVYLNADHTYSVEKVKEAVEAGYDAVIFDGAKLSLEENIAKTKEVVGLIKEIAPHVLVEGEIGNVGSGSRIRKEDSTALRQASSSVETTADRQGKEDLTTPEEAARFVKETRVDLLAPAVGNIHGVLARTNADGTRTYADPRLNIERIKEIKKAAGVPLVLHGASGNTDEDLRAAIEAGVSVVHISTEIRVAWREGVEKSLEEQPDEVAPYKLLSEAEKRIYEVVSQKLKLFSAI